MKHLAVIAVVLGLGLSAAGCAARAARPSGPPPADPLAGIDHAELYARGMAHAGRGDYVRAEQYLSAAMAKGRSPAVVVPALVRVCLADSRLRAALTHAEPYLYRHPDAWSLRYLVATIHLALGDVARARTELLAVAENLPAMAGPHYLLGEMARTSGERRSAHRHFRTYLRLAPAGVFAGQARLALAADASEPGPRRRHRHRSRRAGRAGGTR